MSGRLPTKEAREKNTVDHAYSVMKRLESLQMGVVFTEDYNVMVNSEEFIGTAEYVTL